MRTNQNTERIQRRTQHKKINKRLNIISTNNYSSYSDEEEGKRNN